VDLSLTTDTNYLAFNNYTLTFEGTIPIEYNKETLTYCIKAYDGYETSECTYFSIRFHDSVPKIESKMEN